MITGRRKFFGLLGAVLHLDPDTDEFVGASAGTVALVNGSKTPPQSRLWEPVHGLQVK